MSYIVTLNLLWNEFAEANERRFDLLLQILICRSRSKCRSSFQQTCSILGAMNNIFHMSYRNHHHKKMVILSQISLLYVLICQKAAVIHRRRTLP